METAAVVVLLWIVVDVGHHLTKSSKSSEFIIIIVIHCSFSSSTFLVQWRKICCAIVLMPRMDMIIISCISVSCDSNSCVDACPAIYKERRSSCYQRETNKKALLAIYLSKELAYKPCRHVVWLMSLPTKRIGSRWQLIFHLSLSSRLGNLGAWWLAPSHSLLPMMYGVYASALAPQDKCTRTYDRSEERREF